MTVLFIILLLVFFLTVLALLLPVRLYARGEGSTAGDFSIDGRIHLFDGAAGGGISVAGSDHRLSLYLFQRSLLTINLGPLVKFAVKKKKARDIVKKDKAPKSKEGASASDRIKNVLGNARQYLDYFKKGMAALKETVRFDLVIANVTLGLGNPALTGLATGLIFTLNELLPPSCIITPSFDFTREIVRGDFNIKLKIKMTRLWANVYKYGPVAYKTIKSQRVRHKHAVTQEA